MLDVGQLCKHLGYVIHTPILRFDAGGRPEGSPEDAQGNPLLTDPGFAARLLSMRTEERPAVYHEPEAVIYAVVALPGGGGLVLGPACYGEKLREAERAVCRLHGIGRDAGFHLTPVPLDIFAECALMLFHSVSERRLVRNDLAILNRDYQQVEEAAGLRLEQLVDHYREDGFRHNPYGQEMREQQAIRDGDAERLRQSWRESYDGKVARLGPDVVRHYRNLSIVNITLASRSAIAGGVPPEIAYSMADAYTLETETLHMPGQIIRLFRSAELDFTRTVLQYRGGAQDQPLVNACKELIYRKLHQRITVKDLARELEVSYSYLSERFSEAEHIPLSAFILREKAMASRYDLLHTERTLDEISALYGFSSQSHFGQVFKKWAGMTPGAYRKKRDSLPRYTQSDGQNEESSE